MALCIPSRQVLLLFLVVLLLCITNSDGKRKKNPGNYYKCKGYLKYSRRYSILKDKNCKGANNRSECTIECQNTEACFTLYKNTSRGPKPEVRECWKKRWNTRTRDILTGEYHYVDEDCIDNRTICRRVGNTLATLDEPAIIVGKSTGNYYTGTHAHTWFMCTCCSDFCNNVDYTLEQIENLIIAEPSTIAITSTPTEPAIVENNNNAPMSVIAAVFSAVAFLILAIAIICVVAIRRRNQQHNVLNASDRSSVETPQSGDTQATPIMDKKDSFKKSITKLDFNLPKLAECKARGRFGCVWRAELPGQSSVAVKIFLMQDKDSWLNEQDIFATNLVDSHPFILKFIATATRGAGVNKELWLITEFHEKGSLSDYLYKETMPLPMALNFLKTMANGLAFLHEDIAEHKAASDITKSGIKSGMKPAIAHRDFKSKNVLVRSDMTACIADFGLAIKFIPGQNTGESHGQVGTRRYMAPEVLEGAINFQRDAFLRIDMYAFALVAWEVLTRCSDLPGGYAIKYQLPYEAEFGHQPSMEVMTDHVVDRKRRPLIKPEWRQNKVIRAICESIEECWDNDAEARLPAGCVEERFHDLLHRCITEPKSTTNTDLIITNPTPVVTDNTTMQNLINLQRSQLPVDDEEAALLSPPVDDEEDVV